MPLEDPVVDARALGLRLDDDWELLAELIQVFAEDYPRLMEQLGLALDGADAVLVRKRAHTIKGMAGNLGAERAQRVAFDIEEMGRAGTLREDARSMLGVLRLELERAELELRRLVREMRGL